MKDNRTMVDHAYWTDFMEGEPDRVPVIWSKFSTKDSNERYIEFNTWADRHIDAYRTLEVGVERGAYDLPSTRSKRP